MTVTIFMAILAVVCVFMYLEGRKMNKKLDESRNEILAELMSSNPYGTPLEEDEEYWLLLKHDTAAEMLINYFGDDAGLPDENKMAETIMRYVDALINRLRYGSTEQH